ncbi:hypothetical protein EDB83DRAFT_2323100 [Lactarius deliciosus]|nr:hypothetical protein EDB83DRAFT_2323100 [Lactarius deliciosus]
MCWGCWGEASESEVATLWAASELVWWWWALQMALGVPSRAGLLRGGVLVVEVDEDWPRVAVTWSVTPVRMIQEKKKRKELILIESARPKPSSLPSARVLRVAMAWCQGGAFTRRGDGGGELEANAKDDSGGYGVDVCGTAAAVMWLCDSKK